MRILVADADSVPDGLPEEVAGVPTCVIARSYEPIAFTPDTARYPDLRGGICIEKHSRGFGTTTPLPGSPILTGLTDSAVFSTNGAIDEGRTVTQAIANQGLGQPDLVQAVTDTADPYVQQRVKKRGYLTGPTTGLVIGVLMSFPWGPAGTNRYLIEQVEIAGDEPNNPFFAQPGDSGSLVVDVETPTTAVGLLWGANPGGDWGTVGSGKVGIMSPIRAVEAQLGISVVWA